MSGFIAVGLGGAFGAMLRYACTRWLVVGVLPWATIFVNVVGSFILAALTFWFAREQGSDNLRLFWTTGMMGGFTTYSTFNHETLAFLRNGDIGRALANVGVTTALSLLAAFVGFWLMSRMTSFT